MEKRYPLSKTEEGIYVSCLKETDAYNVANVLNLGKGINLDKLKDSIDKIFEAHPYLNTILFQDEDGKIYKKIVDDKVNIEYKEVSKLDIKPYPFKLLNNHLYYLCIYNGSISSWFEFAEHNLCQKIPYIYN